MIREKVTSYNGNTKKVVKTAFNNGKRIDILTTPPHLYLIETSLRIWNLLVLVENKNPLPLGIRALDLLGTPPRLSPHSEVRSVLGLCISETFHPALWTARVLGLWEHGIRTWPRVGIWNLDPGLSMLHRLCVMFDMILLRCYNIGA